MRVKGVSWVMTHFGSNSLRMITHDTPLFASLSNHFGKLRIYFRRKMCTFPHTTFKQNLFTYKI